MKIHVKPRYYRTHHVIHSQQSIINFLLKNISCIIVYPPSIHIKVKCLQDNSHSAESILNLNFELKKLSSQPSNKAQGNN